jgi:hypothetical protein
MNSIEDRELYLSNALTSETIGIISQQLAASSSERSEYMARYLSPPCRE